MSHRITRPSQELQLCRAKAADAFPHSVLVVFETREVSNVGTVAYDDLIAGESAVVDMLLPDIDGKVWHLNNHPLSWLQPVTRLSGVEVAGMQSVSVENACNLVFKTMADCEGYLNKAWKDFTALDIDSDVDEHTDAIKDLQARLKNAMLSFLASQPQSPTSPCAAAPSENAPLATDSGDLPSPRTPSKMRPAPRSELGTKQLPGAVLVLDAVLVPGDGAGEDMPTPKFIPLGDIDGKQVKERDQPKHGEVDDDATTMVSSAGSDGTMVDDCKGERDITTIDVHNPSCTTTGKRKRHADKDHAADEEDEDEDEDVEDEDDPSNPIIIKSYSDMEMASLARIREACKQVQLNL